MVDKILVVGAGELGLSMLHALAARKSADASLTVLLRPSSLSSPSPSQAASHASLSALGISFLPGDVSTLSPTALSTLFAPYTLIISCLGFASGPGSQLKIAHAVLAAGVERFLPWQFGVDYDVIGRGSAQDLFDEQLDVRDLLRNQMKTKWIIVSTGLFTSFLFESWYGVVDLDDGVVRAFGDWDNKITATGPEDIGRLTAEIVFVEPLIQDQVVFVAGQTLSYGELADLVQEMSGSAKTLRREVWTVEALKTDLSKDPDNAVKKYRVVFAEGKGVSWPVEGTFNEQRGIAVEDVRTWAGKNLRGRLGLD